MSEPLQFRKGPGRSLTRVARHATWARQQGIGRLIEEDQLDPMERIPLAVSKLRWRMGHHIAPNAVPVFLVGVQRSGTNMLVRGLERSAEFEVRNENDRKTFNRFMLRPDARIAEVVRASGQKYVLFKPLCDSHRTASLLDRIDTPSPAKAIWAYRDVDGRVRSAVGKFADANLVALRRIASGEGLDSWQAGGLGPDRIDLIRSFDLDSMSAESAAALFWFVRNSLFFDLGLADRGDVTLASYAHMVSDPEPAMRALCAFLDFPFDPELISHIDRRSDRASDRLPIDPAVRALCDSLAERLDRAYLGKIAS